MPTEDAAQLQAVDIAVSPEDSDLIPATTEQGVARSTDGGATWKATATVPDGQPQALTSVDADHVLVATQDGVYESKDAGKTFASASPVTG
jgi:photosystem II stability/assembly factor-like uncharacterized protein